MAPVSPSTPDRLVDGVVVINLDHRPERLERFSHNAAAYASLRNWERIPAVNGQHLPGYGQKPWFRDGTRDKGWAGRAGCTLSHRQAIATAKARGWHRVLILEDDVEFGPHFDQELQALMQALEDRAAGWHLCFLGVSKPVGPGRPLASLAEGQQLFELFGCIGAFAYVVQSELYDWVLERLPEPAGIWPWIARHRAIDRWYARNLTPHFKLTAVSPSLVGHYTSFSDIGQRAGAIISKDAAHADHSQPIVPCSALFFAVSRLWLRFIFISANPINRIRGWLKQRRGF